MENIYCKNLKIDFTPSTNQIEEIKQTIGFPETFKMFKANSIDDAVYDYLKPFGIKVTFSEIFYTPPRCKMPIHTDGELPRTKLNWIFGADGSTMRWWKPKEGSVPSAFKTDIDTYAEIFDEDNCDCIWTAQVGKPSLLNVSVPHSINNMTDEGRWCLSFVLYDIVKDQHLEWDDAVRKLWKIIKHY